MLSWTTVLTSPSELYYEYACCFLYLSPDWHPHFFFSFFFFGGEGVHTVQQGPYFSIDLTLSTVKVCSPNHWTTREFPYLKNNMMVLIYINAQYFCVDFLAPGSGPDCLSLNCVSAPQWLCDPWQGVSPLWASVSSSVKWGEFCLCLPVGSIYQIRFETLGTSKQIRNGHHVAFIYFLCVVHFYHGEFRAFKSHLCESEWGECCCALQKVLSTAEFQLITWKFTAALLLQVYPTLYSKSVPEKCLHHVIS